MAEAISETQFVSALSVGVSLAGLFWLYFLFREYRVDSLRDDIFETRDEMFFYACENNLLDDPAHKNLRLLMNNIIRYAHQISLRRLIALSVITQTCKITIPESESYIQWKKSISVLSPSHAARFDEFHNKVQFLMLKHVITGSPILLTVGVLVGGQIIVFHSAHQIISKLVNTLSQRIPPIDLLEAAAMRSNQQ